MAEYEHDGCERCKHQDKEWWQEPCNKCIGTQHMIREDLWEPKEHTLSTWRFYPKECPKDYSSVLFIYKDIVELGTYHNAAFFNTHREACDIQYITRWRYAPQVPEEVLQDCGREEKYMEEHIRSVVLERIESIFQDMSAHSYNGYTRESEFGVLFTVEELSNLYELLGGEDPIHEFYIKEVLKYGDE